MGRTMTGFAVKIHQTRENTHSPPTKVILGAALEFAAIEGGIVRAQTTLFRPGR